MSKEEDDLPNTVKVASTTPELVLPQDVSRQMTTDQHVDVDMQVANDAVRLLYYGLSQVKNVSGLCRTVSELMRTLESRRRLALKQDAHHGKKSSPNTIDLLD